MPEPYEPADTAVLSRLTVIVSVAVAAELRPTPPEIVNVSEEAIDTVPVSPAAVNELEATETAPSTYAVVATDVELLPADFVVAVAEAPRANVPENVLFPVIV